MSITKDDVFSVCQACNGRDFVKVSQSAVLKMCFPRQEVNKAPAKAVYPADYFDDLDEATGFSSEDDCDYDCRRDICTFVIY